MKKLFLVLIWCNLVLLVGCGNKKPMSAEAFAYYTAATEFLTETLTGSEYAWEEEEITYKYKDDILTVTTAVVLPNAGIELCVWKNGEKAAEWFEENCQRYHDLLGENSSKIIEEQRIDDRAKIVLQAESNQIIYVRIGNTTIRAAASGDGINRVDRALRETGYLEIGKVDVHGTAGTGPINHFIEKNWDSVRNVEERMLTILSMNRESTIKTVLESYAQANEPEEWGEEKFRVEYIESDLMADSFITNLQVAGESLYYKKTGMDWEAVCKKEMKPEATEEVLYQWEHEWDGTYLMDYIVLPNENLAVVLVEQERVDKSTSNIKDAVLKVVDKNGETIVETNVTDTYKITGWSCISDVKGNIYMANSEKVLVYDSNAKFLFQLDAKGQWIHSIAISKQGTLYVLRTSEQGNGMQIDSVDITKKDYGTFSVDCPYNATAIGAITEQEFLLYTEEGRLIAYDMASENYEEVFDFTEYGSYPQNVESIVSLKNGNIVFWGEAYIPDKNIMKYSLYTMPPRP